MSNEMSSMESRTFILGALTLCIPTWTIAFNLGAYGTVFFEHVFYIWAASLTLLAATWLVPLERAKLTWRGRLLLALPSLWVVLRFLIAPRAEARALDVTLVWAGAAVFIVSFPYVLYVVYTYTNPDVAGIRKAAVVKTLAVVVLIIGLVAFSVGWQHPLFLTDNDFAVSGSMIPARP